MSFKKRVINLFNRKKTMLCKRGVLVFIFFIKMANAKAG